MNIQKLITAAGIVLCSAGLATAQTSSQSSPQSPSPHGSEHSPATASGQSSSSSGHSHSSPDQKQKADASAAAANSGNAVKVVGCLYREGEVPGMQPSILQKAGIGREYVLANATVQGEGKQPAHGQKLESRDTGTSTAGSNVEASLFYVKGIDDKQLDSSRGKRVEVTGQLSGGQSAYRSTSTDTSARGTDTTASGSSSGSAGTSGSGTSTTGAGSGARDTSSSSRSGDRDEAQVPQLQAKSIRVIGGESCPAASSGSQKQ